MLGRQAAHKTFIFALARNLQSGYVITVIFLSATLAYVFVHGEPVVLTS